MHLMLILDYIAHSISAGPSGATRLRGLSYSHSATVSHGSFWSFCVHLCSYKLLLYILCASCPHHVLISHLQLYLLAADSWLSVL